MLTYKDAEHVRFNKPRVEFVPEPRRGLMGWIKDRIFGTKMKPQHVLVIDKDTQERLKQKMENFSNNMSSVAACSITEEDIERASKEIITLARGHHIRNADGTVTDVSNNPKYKCAKPEEL